MKIFTLLSSALIISSALFAFNTNAHNGEEHSDKQIDKDVLYRQSAFTMVRYHFEPLAGMVKGKVPYDAAIATENAEAMAAIAKLAINGFKHKSINDKTKALPAIWENWSDFESKMNDFEVASADLASSAGSLDGLKGAFKNVAQTCKGCHQAYRD